MPVGYKEQEGEKALSNGDNQENFIYEVTRDGPLKEKMNRCLKI